MIVRSSGWVASQMLELRCSEGRVLSRTTPRPLTRGDKLMVASFTDIDLGGNSHDFSFIVIELECVSSHPRL